MGKKLLEQKYWRGLLAEFLLLARNKENEQVGKINISGRSGPLREVESRLVDPRSHVVGNPWAPRISVSAPRPHTEDSGGCPADAQSVGTGRLGERGPTRAPGTRTRTRAAGSRAGAGWGLAGGRARAGGLPRLPGRGTRKHAPTGGAGRPGAAGTVAEGARPPAAPAVLTGGRLRRGRGRADPGSPRLRLSRSELRGTRIGRRFRREPIFLPLGLRLFGGSRTSVGRTVFLHLLVTSAKPKGSMKPVKKKKTEEPELEPLCCCEYMDRNGEKNHMAACLCDCQDLDEGCDRWFTCKSVQPETCERIMDTISDRLRIPWLRGAKKINISIIPPLVLLPVFLHVASWHFLLGVVVLTSLPVLALWYYYLTHRRKEQTLFFLSLGLFSLGYMYYVFLLEVVPEGRVGPTQLAVLTCGLFLILFALYRAKKNPGYLSNPASNDKSLSSSQIECLDRKGQEKTKGFPGTDTSGSLNNRTLKDDLKSSSRMLAGSPTKVKEDWCAKCQLVRPARAWHCRICGICVRRMDHHCVWINSCVGESNHQAFILALLIFLLTSVYGITLTLDTICRDRSIFTALFYCPGVYSNHSSALSFTCVWYSVIITSGMAYIFLIQLINISYNVTEREVQQALRQKTGRRLLWGLIVDTGQYNRGFLRNWHQFSTLGTCSFHHPAEDIV